MAITNSGGNLNSVPSARQQALESNYLDLASTANQGWAQQYVPDLMEQEAEVFGPRTISGFLEQVGAEEAMTADQVVWSEQGRLHLSYTGNVNADNKITITKDIDGLDESVGTKHGIRVNDMLIVANSDGVFKCIATAVSAAGVIDVKRYDAATLSSNTTADGTTVLVYGSEFAKGTKYNSSAAAATDRRGSNEPTFKSFSNKPIIMKDYYEVSGSDASRIGWIEVSSEGGASGYLWYLKAQADTRARFNDYVEMAMLESEKDGTGSTVDDFLGASGDSVGTEGLFAAIEDRGNEASGITGVNAATDLAEFDAILKEFDKQGAIEEYMMFVNRDASLAIDDMLASMNSYGASVT